MTKQARKQNMRDYLERVLFPGDTIFGIVHRASGSGFVLQILLARHNGIEDITRATAFLCGFRICTHGLLVKGTGFNHTQAVSEALEQELGFKVNYKQVSTIQN